MLSRDIDCHFCFLPFPKTFKKVRYDLLAYTPRNVLTTFWASFSE